MNNLKFFVCFLFLIANTSSFSSDHQASDPEMEEMGKVMAEQLSYMTCKYIADNLNEKNQNPLAKWMMSKPEMTNARDACMDVYPELFEEPSFLTKLWRYLFN